MSDHILVVPDPAGRVAPDWSRASAYVKRFSVPVSRRNFRVASALMRLTGRSDLIPAGLKANGKPDDRYTHSVLSNCFNAREPFSAVSSRDQTPLDTPRGTHVDDQPFEIVEEQQIIHEDILTVPEPATVTDATPRPKTKRGSRPVESAQ